MKVLFYLALITSLLTLGLYYLLVQSHPLVDQTNFLNATSAQHSQKLVKRLLGVTQSTNDTRQPIILTFSEDELKGLSGLSHRAIPQLSSYVDVTPLALKLAFTYEAPLPFAKRFINIHLKVLPSLGLLSLREIKVGNLSITKKWFFRLFRWGINSQVKEGLGDKLIEAIQSVNLSHRYVVLAVQLPSDLTSENEEEYVLFKEIRDKLAIFGDVTKVRYYYQQIFDFSQKLSVNNSLSRYICFVFRQAKLQTSRLENTTAVIENRAALTALALFFGPDRFMLLVGDMESPTLKENARRRLLQNITTLHHRVDLQKHYIYSIVLQLVGSQNSSDAIGEMKEFLDSHKGGSGFSFVDLLADRAGTRLALSATQSEEKALYIQEFMDAKFSEFDVIPSLKNLPENISQIEFEKRYGDINSKSYKELLTEIDNRVYQLNLYQ